MPAFYTHRYFAKQVYQDFKPALKKQINYEYYLFFAQSFDIPSFVLKKAKNHHLVQRL